MLALLLSPCLLFGGLVRGQMPEGMPMEMLDDAELRDVHFVDSDQGWAVGDRGVIWHTEDGGRHWQLQRVPATAGWESVHFIDSQTGWVVGGEVQPYTHRTRSVVARTQDGGRTWTLVPGLTLPALKHVQFHNDRQGWAVGNSSTMYPAGVFRTEDGGRSWVTIPCGGGGKWTAADFPDESRGVVVGHDGRLSVVAVPEVLPSRTPELGPRAIRAVRIPDGRHGWLVGDGGLIMQTSDGGLSWQTPAGALPPGAANLLDLRALAVLGPHVWAAGAPGSVVLHSADAGGSWEIMRTEQRVPLRSLTFVDADRGWAVGSLGTILATRDGGRTWRSQRTGGTRLALLGFFSEAVHVPFELFALQSGNEGYLGYAEILNRRDIEIPSVAEAPLEDLASAALSAVGACGAGQAWRFPLRQEGLRLSSSELMRIWDRVNDDRGIALLEELVVRRIRQWRPEVIITEPSSPRGERPLSHLVNQVVLSAVTNAADATSYPEHAIVAGLEPWQVKKVYCTVDDAGEATVRLTTAQLATRLGRSVAEQALAGHALVERRYETVPAMVGYRLLLDGLPQSAGRSDVFSGIFLQPGGDARRQTGQPLARDLESLARAAQLRRNMDQLFALTAGDSSQAASWLGQLQDLTRSLSGHSGGQVLFELGQRYRDAGQGELAAQTLEQLVSQYPDHPLAESALVWLVQYYASGEVAWQLRRGTHAVTQVVATEAESAARVQRVVPAAFLTTAAPQQRQTERAGLAIQYSKAIQQRRPELYAEPWVQFPTATAFRAQGVPRDAERMYHRLGSALVPSDWERCAQAELWLMHGRGKPPKLTFRCTRGTERPHLDGDLTDPIWREAEVLELSSALHDDEAWPAAAMLACDDEFLYLAVTCRKVSGRPYAAADGPRPRDPELTDRDRVDLLLDLDRDFTSFYHLTVDHRGWTGEASFGSRHWDPTWYVASQETGEQWTVEAAIAFAELSPSPPRKDDVWAVGLQRVVPGVGIQAVTQPAAVHPRGESFGLIVFQ